MIYSQTILDTHFVVHSCQMKRIAVLLQMLVVDMDEKQGPNIVLQPWQLTM